VPIAANASAVRVVSSVMVFIESVWIESVRLINASSFFRNLLFNILG
jgi:hypothetical protein